LCAESLLGVLNSSPPEIMVEVIALVKEGNRFPLARGHCPEHQEEFENAGERKPPHPEWEGETPTVKMRKIYRKRGRSSGKKIIKGELKKDRGYENGCLGKEQ